MGFIHLHVHTEYSLLDGSSKISELVARTKELGMDSIAITDHGVMYGVIDFYKAAKKAGIKPILGCEVYVAPDSRFDREASSSEERYHHLVLLAENNTGYSNLMKIVTRGFTEGFYYKPRVDHQILEEFHEGVIALSACLAGEIAVNIRKGQYEEAKKRALSLEQIFGKGNFFLELQDHGIGEQKTVNQGLMRIHEETGIELVATNDCHYTYDTDAEAHDILLCIQTQKKVSDDNRMRYEGGQYYVKSPDEMASLFPYAKEALENTGKIAERCQVEIEFGSYKLPKYDVPEGFTAWEYLQKLCRDGLERRYGVNTEPYEERMNYELETIRSMGFIDYFLIVWDFLKYARDNGIMVGPGRGSAAGSIVSYVLQITDIDPIPYQLLFERFLNQERLTMPDIDIDFCFERRQEVIDYVVRKYGSDRVVQIITFGTMAAKAAIRDVGRALDYGYAYVDNVAKMVPTEPGMTIGSALKMNPELKKAYESEEQIKYLIDMSMRLEGLPRHTSMHAAGVVISNRAAEEYVPLSKTSDNTITTQFTMTTLEELGLLKMDFLGLRTLTVIQNAIRLVNKGRSQSDEFLLEHINYKDKKVFDSIGSGKTDGVFQLESAGMKNFIKELKPESMEDIIAGISLYRPGPMEFIPKYVKGKNTKDSIQYECPQLESILAPTHGCIVYQEQVMQIVRELAGYSFGRSDLVRRAMSKKKADVMEKERKNFVYGNEEEGVTGCISNGISEKAANHIFDEMTDFAKYAFNKSHAAAYAVISYQTAYLKYHYPIEYMAALLTSVKDNAYKITEYIYSSRQMGIPILPPDINEGEGNFSVSGKSIRYGLSAIKGIGTDVIEGIVSEREAGGKYTGLRELAERLSGKEMNKRTLENFIKAGALDSLTGTRKQKMYAYAGILDGINRDRKSTMKGQISFFDFLPPEEKTAYETSLPDVGEYDKDQILMFEKEVLGVYISGHPLEADERMLLKNITAKTIDFSLDEESGKVTAPDGETAIIGGLIIDKTVKITRNNSVMAFLTVEDLYGTVEVIVFPRDYEKYKDIFTMDSKVFIWGKITVEEEKAGKLICSKILPFDQVGKELWVKFPDKEKFLENEEKLMKLLENYDGKDEVCIYCEKEKVVKRLPHSRDIHVEETLIQLLNEVFGSENIRISEKSIEKIAKMN